MINDQLDPKIWPSKAQRSVKDFSSEHIPVTHIQLKSLGNNFQSHCSCNCIHLHATAFRMILWQFHPQLWEIFCQHEVCPMLTHQSWQASSISRFRAAAAFSSSRKCAWWQTVRDTFFQPFRNAISRQSQWQISSSGACMVIAQLMYHPKLLFHWFIAFLSQASFPQVGTVWTYSRIGVSTHYHVTLQCINVMHPAHNSVHERIFHVNAGFIWQSLCTRQYAEFHLNPNQWKSSDLLITWCRSLLLLLDHILLPCIFFFQLLHLTTLKCQRKSSTSWSMIMKGSKELAKQSTNKCQKLLSKNIPVTQSGRFCQSLGNTFQSHRSTCSCIYLQTTTFWIISRQFHPQLFLRNPLPTWDLADAHTSVLAGCFHFTLPNSCCPFFLAKARLVPVGPGIHSFGIVPCSLEAISWFQEWCLHDDCKDVPAPNSCSTVSSYRVNICQDRNIHTIPHYNV